MILGRPTNLWLGFLTAATGFVGILASAIGHPLDPAVLGGAVAVEGSFILLVAYAPPTLSPGDTFKVATPAGQPSYETTVATPPSADPPPKPVTGP